MLMFPLLQTVITNQMKLRRLKDDPIITLASSNELTLIDDELTATPTD